MQKVIVKENQMYKLLEPIKIGKRIARNRMVMPPMETRLFDKLGDSTDAAVDYYARRAKGGVGMVIVENTFVDELESRSSIVSSGLYSDHLVAGKFRVAEGIKKAGALAILQLSHGGRQCVPGATGLQPVAPSAVMCKFVQRMPRELTIEEIVRIEDAFATAAGRAKQAGFDGIEIHGAHGYLISSFLSPYTNKRNDEYGGDRDKRATFPKNIIRKIRATVGENFIVGYRITAADYVEGGLTIEDTSYFAKSVEDEIDYIHVSAGIYESMAQVMISPMYQPRNTIVELPIAMKKVITKIPVIAVNSIDVPDGEKLLQENGADMISFGRSLIADPDLPKKVKEGRVEDIRPCIRGHEGCISLFFAACPMRCEVNPEAGREESYKIKKVADPKKIVVIGGGMAGMESARVAEMYGHSVTLIEQSSQLGGHFIEAGEPSFKIEIKNMRKWLIRQIEKSSVEVLMGTTATTEMVKEMNPDAIIIAVGSEYIKPGIPGIENTITGAEAIMNSSATGEEVVVIGGGLVGTETALHLMEKGKKVTIIEALGELVPEDDPLSKIAIGRRIQSSNANVLLDSRVVSIGKNSVTYTSGGEEKTVNADTIVAALGLGARSKVASEFEALGVESYVIGDAVKGGKLFNCTHDAWYAVRCISGLE